MMAAQRIDKLLASTGRYSRREAAALAKRGAVAVDGVCCKDASRKVDPEQQVLTVEGERIGYEPFVYLMLHKPCGVLSATEDRDQQTVLDLLPDRYRTMGVFPVGRLDKDTSGLLLLTNDGPLGHRLTSPKHGVKKIYLAETDGTPDEAAVQAFAEGLTLRDGTQCRPALLEILTQGRVRVTVQEGKYHQVRRMLAACGTPVLTLKRLQEGGIPLDEQLQPGEWRPLTEAERTLL